MKYVAIAAAVLGLAAINTAGTAKAEDFGVTIRAGESHNHYRHSSLAGRLCPRKSLPGGGHASHQWPRRSRDGPQEGLRLIANARGTGLERAAVAAAFSLAGIYALP